MEKQQMTREERDALIIRTVRARGIIMDKIHPSDEYMRHIMTLRPEFDNPDGWRQIKNVWVHKSHDEKITTMLEQVAEELNYTIERKTA